MLTGKQSFDQKESRATEKKRTFGKMEAAAPEVIYSQATALTQQIRQNALSGKVDDSLHQDLRKLYLRAAELGHVPSQAQAAMCLAYAIGGQRDAELHRRYVDAAAEAGDPAALGMRAENFWFGENGYPIDIEKCAADAERSWRADNWLGSTVYTWALNKKAEGLDSAAASELLRLAEEIAVKTVPVIEAEAKEGDAIAQDWLAWRFYNGEGVAKDAVAAARWLRMSAEQGRAWAKVWLGLRYLTGDGVEKDVEQARTWLKKAAAQGIPEAIKELERLGS